MSYQKNNPQIPLDANDAIRVIVDFPMPENFVNFVETIRGAVFAVEFGGKDYKAVAYSSGDKTQAIKISLNDPEEAPAVVTMIMHVYMPLDIITELKKSSEIIIKTK